MGVAEVLEALYRNALDLDDEETAAAIRRCDERRCLGEPPTLGRGALERATPEWLTGNALREACLLTFMETNAEAYR